MLPTTKGGGSPQHSRWPLLIATRILMNHVNPERGGGERCEEDAIVKIGRTTETIHLSETRISDTDLLSCAYVLATSGQGCEYVLRMG